VKAYWSLLSARFRMLLQYRAAALAGLGTQLFWGVIRMMVFEAFYRSTDAAQPMSLPDIITYVWLTQAMLHLVPLYMYVCAAPAGSWLQYGVEAEADVSLLEVRPRPKDCRLSSTRGLG